MEHDAMEHVNGTTETVSMTMIEDLVKQEDMSDKSQKLHYITQRNLWQLKRVSGSLQARELEKIKSEHITLKARVNKLERANETPETKLKVQNGLNVAKVGSKLTQKETCRSKLLINKSKK